MNEYESEEPRERIDPENFMELKKFVNKYREKLVIKSKIKLTKVDMLEGKAEKAAREDQIDFDFQNFKDSCLAGTMSGKWDNEECRRQLRVLKRNLLKNFDLTRQVHARFIQ